MAQTHFILFLFVAILSVVVIVVVVVVVVVFVVKVHRISNSTFYCTHDSAGLQDKAMVTWHDNGKGQNGDGRHNGDGRQGDGMTATGGTTKRHDDGDAQHDDGDPRSWDGGAIVARRGQLTLLIAVTGERSLAR